MKLRLLDKRQEINGVESFVFKPESPLNWQPGQYLHYTLPHPEADDRGVERWFTISTAPYEKNIQITTRLDGEIESSFKKALAQLNKGEEIEAEGPGGKFILKEGDVRHILIAGGIGITPYRSMLAQLIHDDKPANAELIYLNRDDSFVFGEELEKYAATDSSFKLTRAVDKKLTEADFKPLIDDSKTVFYLSGPHGMVEAYENMLKKMGLAEDRIKTDYFPGY
ncbi:MAG TPA: FAD-dependent oxidoreductase [Candidatus Saccharimonadales bacterium]|nr:FAD-dependent oxidoreductase [Candidatus Saccharimonadales bacterium]